MATEILRPQDCLAGRVETSTALFPRRRGCNYGNSYSNNRINSNPSPNSGFGREQQHLPIRSEKTEHRRRFGRPPHSVSKRSVSADCRAGRTGLVMEKVTILRRGSSLDPKVKSELSLKKEADEPAAEQVLAPNLHSPIIRESIMYSGSNFGVSPEPSSLPLPSFPKKKIVRFEDSATRDLHRMLRLD